MSGFILYSDGGARGNPGPAGIGVLIEQEGERGKEREKVREISQYIGETTNNQAEYRAVIEGLRAVKEMGGGESVECVLDSELVVEQLNGRYRVKNAALKPLYSQVMELASALGVPVTFRAVPRAKNRYTDKLVNRAIDEAAAR